MIKLSEQERQMLLNMHFRLNEVALQFEQEKLKMAALQAKIRQNHNAPHLEFNEDFSQLVRRDG